MLPAPHFHRQQDIREACSTTRHITCNKRPFCCNASNREARMVPCVAATLSATLPAPSRYRKEISVPSSSKAVLFRPCQSTNRRWSE